MAGVLSAAELAALQTVVALNFTTSVVIEAQSDVDDGQGGFTLTWATVLSVAARRTDLSGNEQLIAQQVTNTQMKRFHIAVPAVALDTSMRLTDSDGVIYNIRDISTPGPYALTTVLLCERIPNSPGV